MKKLLIFALAYILIGSFTQSYCQQANSMDLDDHVEIKYVGLGLLPSGFGSQCKISRKNMSDDETNDYFQKVENIIKNNFSKTEIFYVGPDAHYVDIEIMLNGKHYHYSSMHPFFHYDEEVKAALEFDQKFIIGFNSLLNISLDLLNKKLSPNKAIQRTQTAP